VPVIFIPNFLGTIVLGYNYLRKELCITSVDALCLVEQGRPSRANPSYTKLLLNRG